MKRNQKIFLFITFVIATIFSFGAISPTPLRELLLFFAAETAFIYLVLIGILNFIGYLCKVVVRADSFTHSAFQSELANSDTHLRLKKVI
jgi:hypothetical protein